MLVVGGGASAQRRATTDGDLNALVGEDEGGVGRGKLGGRHCEGREGFCAEMGVVVAVVVLSRSFWVEC